MNILIYFANQLSPTSGGTERVACMIADALIESGHNVEYIACLPTDSNDVRPAVFLPDKVDAPTPANISFIKDYISSRNIDVVINEGANTDSVFLFSHEHIATDVKIISHLHFNVRGGLDTLYKSQYLPLLHVPLRIALIHFLKWLKTPYNKHRALRNKRFRFGYMHCQSDKIVVLSEKQVALLGNLIGENGSPKIESIINPLSFKPSIDTNYAHEKILLFVGRLDYETKRVDRVLRAWKLASKQMPDWQLKIVGDGNDKERLQRLVMSKRIPRVEFTGKADAQDHYRSASMLLLTSNHEGTPMVIPEAMSHGVVPVVMNNFTDAGMFIHNGENGLLTPPFDVMAFSKSIEELASDEVRLQRMSSNAIVTVSNFAAKTDTFSRWLSIIEK